MSLHPEAYTPSQQVAAQVRQLTERVRRLEGRRSAIPLSAAPATPESTTSATAVALWQITGVFPAGWEVTVTVRLAFDTDGARGWVELRDATGHTVAASSGADGAIVKLTAVDPPTPLTLYGHVNTGTLFVTVTAAQAAPRSEPADGD